MTISAAASATSLLPDVVRHEDGDLGFVVANGLRDLERRQNQPAGSVKDHMSSGTSPSVIWLARRTSSESLMSM